MYLTWVIAGRRSGRVYGGAGSGWRHEELTMIDGTGACGEERL